MIEINKYKLVPGTGGDAVWGGITGNISDQSDLMSLLSGFTTEEWVMSQEFATESWVSSQGFLTSETLPSDLATESWVQSQGYLTSIPSEYATQSWVESQGFLTSETLPSDIATEGWVSSNFLSSDALSGYATESWVTSNFLSSDALSGYATESWVMESALSGYATEFWVWQQSFLVDSDMRLQTYLPGEPMIYGNTKTTIPADVRTTYGNRALFNINGDIYLYASKNKPIIYKFDRELFTFVKVADASQTVGYDYVLWEDTNHNTYLGVSYKVNLETGEVTAWDFGTGASDIYLNQNQNKHNIINFGGKILLVKQTTGTAYVFDESTQTFDMNNPMTMYVQYPNDNWYRWFGEFEGHYLYTLDQSIDGTTQHIMCEMKSNDYTDPNITEDIVCVMVNNPEYEYFPVDANGGSIGCNNVHRIQYDEWTYEYVLTTGNYVYNLAKDPNTGAMVWEQRSFSYVSTSNSSNAYGAQGCNPITHQYKEGQGYLLFGYSSDSGAIAIWNFSDTNYFLNDFVADMYTRFNALSRYDSTQDSSINSLSNRVSNLENEVGSAITITENILS